MPNLINHSGELIMHTPGPWKLIDEDLICPQISSESIGKGHYSIIASVTCRDAHPLYGGEIKRTTALTNAKLIAAAPALLEALQELESAFMSFTQWQGEPPQSILKARDAIKQATL